MRAIKIPQPVLLDVFGRHVSINNPDLRQPTFGPDAFPNWKANINAPNGDRGSHRNSKEILGTIPPTEHPEQLTVIG